MENTDSNHKNELIRISAANLARIELDGKILVGLNKKRLKAGKKVYTPFGGAIEFYEPARTFLESLGAQFEKGMDLRFIFQESNLPVFERWFYVGNDREVLPYRELREELVEEERALPNLSERDVYLEYIATLTERAISDRPSQEGMETQRYFEIYRALFNENCNNLLRVSLRNPGTHLALVSEDEIRCGKSDSDVEIATSCRGLIYDR